MTSDSDTHPAGGDASAAPFMGSAGRLRHRPDAGRMTHAQLRAVAEAATPGLWTFDGNCAGYVRASDFEDEPSIARAYAAADSKFIATFDPPTVLGLLAELEAARGRGWQPIETAPKDGTPVDLWLTNPALEIGGMRITDATWLDGAWREYSEWDNDGNNPDQVWFAEVGQTVLVETSLCKVTHWQPLPEPPALAEPTP